jgi:four helix bundle protein
MLNRGAFRELETWQEAMMFVEECYKATALFPTEERYGLTSQLRRAAVSVPSNVAEGYCRRSDRVYAHHVSIALGSHAEVETCIDLANRLGFITVAQRAPLDRRAGTVGRLLSGLHRSLEVKIAEEDIRPRRST